MATELQPIELRFRFEDHGHLHDIVKNATGTSVRLSAVDHLDEKRFWQYAAKSGRVRTDNQGDVHFDDGSQLDDPSDVVIDVPKRPMVTPGLGDDWYVYDVHVTVPAKARWRAKRHG
jgi:hypothetical protein